MKRNNKLTWRDMAWFSTGCFVGVAFVGLLIYLWLVGITNAIQIDQVVITLNETKLVEEAYKIANATGGLN